MAGANIKVELDTKPAQKKLQQLGKQGEATARRVSSGRDAGGGFGGGLAQGFGIGAGFSLGKKIAGSVGVFSAVGDVVGEAFSGVSARVDSEIGAPSARAKNAARAETRDNYRMIVGITENAAGAKQYFDNVLRSRFLPEAKGEAMINESTGGSKGNADPNISRNPMDHVFDGVVDKIEKGFDALIDAVKGGG